MTDGRVVRPAGVRAGGPETANDPGLDTIGWFIATTHQLLGHDKTAVILGQPAGDKSACVICLYEREPTADRRQAVIRALAPRQEPAS